MKNLSSAEIRQQFIDFFRKKEHKEGKSSPVIPIDDPTLLFANAGMNQFKHIFLGQTEADYKRVVNSQKCIRAGGKHNDLEEVGKDGYHHTFFEMLGNWSFGDYYKKEAIQWAWELLTKWWKLPKDKLYATVYKTDKEAHNIWKAETDIANSHIEFHGEQDNFWEMGETGPCGPCSEIHFDRGVEFCNLKDDSEHECKVNGDCHRYIELWNLVFIQYNRDEQGKLNPLPKQYVDTGAGLERIAQVLQKKRTNYETDLFMPIINAFAEMASVKYREDEAGVSHRVIADHIRALSFSIADGGMPSNEGRGYVIRRILRRAARHGRLLELKEPFLYKLVDVVIDIMGDHYVELQEKKKHIKLMIKAEEERFNLTLDRGLAMFEEMADQTDKTIPGKAAFKLYDTYGFPLDLTKVMAEERGLDVDEAGFKKAMGKQKQRARDAANFKTEIKHRDWIKFLPDASTVFKGYKNFETKAKIQKYSIDDNNNVMIVLNRTPFYAESGGQIADSGKIYNDESVILVEDVQKENEQYIHYGKLVKGEIVDSDYTAAVDKEIRLSTARNHTATHLLHKALKEVLGEHVQQKGSLVDSQHLRFDFTHFQKTDQDELRLIENIVNHHIRKCTPVTKEVKDFKTAKKEGATALFGEKYGDKVRVVTIGDFSKELCGGTHLEFTGQIGLFLITAESSIAAGIRRIEAYTGKAAFNYVKNLEIKQTKIANRLKTGQEEMLEKLDKLLADAKNLSKENRKLKQKIIINKLESLIDSARIIDDVKVVSGRLDISEANEMRELGDILKNKLKAGIGVLIADIGDKVSILTVVTKNLTKKYKAGQIVNEVARIVDGRGGGRPDMAMAGGKNTAKIDAALAQVPNIIKKLG